jgi:hypothetical protein
VRALSSCWGCYGHQATAGTFRTRWPPTRRLGRPFTPRDFRPTLEAVPHLCAVRRRGQPMPSWSEVVGHGAIRRQKTLGMPRGCASLHPILALACGPMRVLTAVVERTTLPVFHPGQDLALRCPVALQLLRDDHPGHVLQALEQLAKKLLRGLAVAPTRHEDVEDVVVLIGLCTCALRLMATGLSRAVSAV